MNTLQTELNDQGILLIKIDVPGETINVFNQEVMKDFEELANDIETNSKIKAVIFTSGKPEGFIAGADLKMLQQIETAMDGAAMSLAAHNMLSRITNSPKPHIAAIDGVCLGGGYELALACHYRIATDSRKTKIGLPEVMAGLLPGATGTSKLPRLISLPSALDMLLTGKQIDAKRAKRLGMIDEVVSSKILMKAAYIKANKLISSGIPERDLPWKDKLLTLPAVKNFIINKARQQVLKKTQGNYPAPLALLEVIKQGLNKPLDECLKLEAEKFGELTVSDEAKQLINIYFATTSLKKETYINGDVTPATVKTLGILGGGLMGAGIATTSIDKANASVRIKDIRDEGILGAHNYIAKFYDQRVKRRILSKEQARKKMNQLTGSLDYQGFEKADLIIEAVFEDIAVKHQMVEDIESLGNENIVFASNTSSIPLTDIASKAKRPENILGMHYFSPVEKMPLLEIIKHPGTSEQALATAVDFGRKQGKTVIVVNDGAGFYVNRILVPYMNAAIKLGMDGLAFDKIDKAMVKFGFPVGPFKLMDEVGIDIGNKIMPVLENAFGDRMKATGIEATFIKNNRLGRKTKKGFYRYDDPKLSKEIDTTVYEELNITPDKEMNEKEIVERCIFPLLNEAVMALDDNIVLSPRDGDIGAVFGIGFPPFLGGPFRYMDTMGISYVVDKLESLVGKAGDNYQPAEKLKAMTENNEKFYE